MTLLINSPSPVKTMTRVLYCPRCRKRRRVSVKFYEWYAPSARCTALRRRWKRVVKPCGYQWGFE